MLRRKEIKDSQIRRIFFGNGADEQTGVERFVGSINNNQRSCYE